MTGQPPHPQKRGRSHDVQRTPSQLDVTKPHDVATASQAPSRLPPTIMTAAWSGQFPHPDDAERYERLYPGFIERHFQLLEKEQGIVENQSAHRRNQEQQRLGSDIRYEGLGLTYAFILAVLLIIGAFILGLYGHDTLAGVFITAGLVSGVGAFIVGRRGAARERVAKLQALTNGTPSDTNEAH